MPPIVRTPTGEQSAPVLVTGRTAFTPWVVVPGIVAGAAYASGDAMGSQFRIDMAGSKSGFIVGMLVSDLDKEQLPFDVFLFDGSIQGVADNAAFALLDQERFRFRGHISIGTGAPDYAASNAEAVGTVRLAPPLAYVCPQGYLVAQCVTRGVPNYTAATDLALCLMLIPDLG